ncbi:nucleotide exchange factor GrpE [Limisphaera sp. 4302-co]|uniref:nucleotide exchange factor GrpE n=1 Tax=Limisphaera sp. 4302-co TaxID=3400417 RepID=UPI003C1692BE
MDASEAPRIRLWPFLLGDAVLLAAAVYWVAQAKFPLSAAVVWGSTICLVTGAALGVAPFWLEYRALCRRLETATLAEGLLQARHAEAAARRIAEATDNWQMIQDQAARTAAQAREIAERMAAEVREFTAFLERANDTEKATLRLEVEKLRRAEGEWLQVLVWILDHVYALYTAGLRSGQPRLIEQLTQFQNHCRDAARRLGVVPFEVPPGEPFQPERHQTPDGQTPPEGSVVRETLATGILFQGRLVRPAVVAVEPPASDQTARPDAKPPATEQPELTAPAGTPNNPLQPDPASDSPATGG